MRWLIGYSTCPHTRAAFEAQGHEVWTCDLRPDPHPRHLQCDIWEVAGDSRWDAGIFHPTCTYLTTSAAWAFKDGPYHQKVAPGTLVGAARRAARDEAIENFKRLDALPYPHAIENPARNFVNKAYRPPDMTVQPYDYGDDASKLTGFWLRDLPPLVPTERVPGRMVWYDGKLRERWANQMDSGQSGLAPGEDRWLIRSRTYPGIAAAMGQQWGGLWKGGAAIAAQ